MNKKQTKTLLFLTIIIIGAVIISGCIGNEQKETIKQTISESNYTTQTTSESNYITNGSDYFPLSIGNSWSYYFKVETGETKVQKIADIQILKKEKIDGVETYAMEYKLGDKVLQIEYYTNEKEKVICHKRILSGTNFDINPPQLLYDFSSLKKGEKWEWNGKVGEQEARLKGKVLGEETITVPAGTFKTYRVKIIVRDSGGMILVSTDRWFAQGVGMVKEESIDGSIFVGVELKEYGVNK